MGFDGEGHVKLFDFGLARELKECDRVERKSNLYRLEGMTGTLRYMAPEVAKRLSYGLHADIYSMGVPLWQIVALRVPFENRIENREEFFEQVIHGGMRPPVSLSSFYVKVSDVIEKFCSAEIEVRPEAEEVCEALLEQIELLDIVQRK